MNNLKNQIVPLFLSCACILPTLVQAADVSTDSITINGPTPFLSLNAPAQTWDIKNDNDEFSISDRTNSRVPFVISSGITRPNAFFIDFEGKVGLGTNTPGGTQSSKLTIADAEPGITFFAGNGSQQWDFFGESTGAGIFDVTANTTPFGIAAGADSWSLLIDSAGQVGFGTQNPAAKVHAVIDDSNYLQPLVLENVNAINFSGFRLKIAPNSWIDFNNSGGTFRINADQVPGSEFEVRSNGNATLSGVLTQNSDVNAKQDIVAVDQRNVLAKVMQLHVSEWSYKDAPASRHIGPMAQDFYKSFGLGDTATGITSIDTGGVALAAIQGVKKEKDREIESLKTQLQQQQERMMQLEILVTELMLKQTSQIQLSSSN